MNMEQRTPLMAKKLCGIVRLILYMAKKNLSQNIPWFELHMMLKRSTKIAGKAIGNLLLEHRTLSCRPNDIRTSFIAPVEYEFSCTHTPVFYAKRKNTRNIYSKRNGGLGLSLYQNQNHRSRKNNDMTVSHVRKVFDSLNNSLSTNYEAGSYVEPEKSPLTLLGIGESPNVRQLRVTDSPFPEKNIEEDTLQVDKAAEEFIKNFYKDLKQQKKRAATEPPSPLIYRTWNEFQVR